MILYNNDACFSISIENMKKKPDAPQKKITGGASGTVFKHARDPSDVSKKPASLITARGGGLLL